MSVPPWIQVIGSVYFDLTAPKVEDINFETIATVLARLARFGGQTENGPLPVAQHCSEGALAILRDTGRKDWAFDFLLHDGHEAIMGCDIPNPTLAALMVYAGDAGSVLKVAVKSLKKSIDAAIYRKAGRPWPLDSETQRVIAEYDIRMCRTERDARMAPSPGVWVDAIEQAEPVRGVNLTSWPAHYAREQWLRVFHDLRG